jgi:hypothetical protein
MIWCRFSEAPTLGVPEKEHYQKRTETSRYLNSAKGIEHIANAFMFVQNGILTATTGVTEQHCCNQVKLFSLNGISFLSREGTNGSLFCPPPPAPSPVERGRGSVRDSTYLRLPLGKIIFLGE